MKPVASHICRSLSLSRSCRQTNTSHRYQYSFILAASLISLLSTTPIIFPDQIQYVFPDSDNDINFVYLLHTQHLE